MSFQVKTNIARAASGITPGAVVSFVLIGAVLALLPVLAFFGFALIDW